MLIDLKLQGHLKNYFRAVVIGSTAQFVKLLLLQRLPNKRLLPGITLLSPNRLFCSAPLTFQALSSNETIWGEKRKKENHSDKSGGVFCI